MPADPVLYVLRWYPTLTETFVYREIEALQRRGQPVIIAAMGARADGLRNDRLPDVEVWHRGFALRARWRRVQRVHAHFDGEASVLAASLAAKLGVPYSVTVHAADLFRPRAGIRARLQRANPTITVCAHHVRWLQAHHGVRASLVRCGVELPVAVAAPEHQPPRVVTVARNVPKKDLDRLRAVAPEAEILSESTGHEVHRALREAQVFALPCRIDALGGRDGIPVAMMEAMAHGLPVVTRPIAGIPELVDDEVGWVDTDFEAALQQALGDPDARRHRGAAARDRIRSGWTIERSVDDLLTAWGTLRP